MASKRIQKELQARDLLRDWQDYKTVDLLMKNCAVCRICNEIHQLPAARDPAERTFFIGRQTPQPNDCLPSMADMSLDGSDEGMSH